MPEKLLANDFHNAGNVAHIVYMVLCLLNNLFASANMLLGASAAISAITGINIIAATFLLPVGGRYYWTHSRITLKSYLGYQALHFSTDSEISIVAAYTFVGGIKATLVFHHPLPQY